MQLQHKKQTSKAIHFAKKQSLELQMQAARGSHGHRVEQGATTYNSLISNRLVPEWIESLLQKR